MVKLYTTPICPMCFVLKTFLKEHNVEFAEIDASQDEKTTQNLIKKTGKMEVPIVEKNGQFVVGFDREKITNLLNIKD